MFCAMWGLLQKFAIYLLNNIFMLILLCVIRQAHTIYPGDEQKELGEREVASAKELFEAPRVSRAFRSRNRFNAPAPAGVNALIRRTPMSSRKIS